MKRLLFLIALIAGVAMAHVQRYDAIKIDGKRCSFSTYPLNKYISNHYSEWPFRPTFRGPGDGGGYWGFWSIRDSLLYLDSVTINTWGRSSIVVGHGDRKHFSVRIPLQEIIRDRSNKKSRQALKKDGSLYAYFVNDTFEVSCLNDFYKIYVDTVYVKNGRVRFLQHSSNDGTASGLNLLLNSKNKKSKRVKRLPKPEKKIRPYNEKTSLFTTYYYTLDNLRKKQDESDKQKYIVEPRQDPNFKRFEDFFEINAVDLDYVERNKTYTFFVTPKEKTPFLEFVFYFVMDGIVHEFKDSPADAVELFEKSYAAIRKNPALVKWLQEKKSKMNYRDVSLKREEKTYVWFREASIEDVWTDAKMSGKYVATMTFNGVLIPQYKFLLSHNGYVLVSWASPPEGETILDIANDADKNNVHMKYCHEPVVGETVPSEKPLFCDYAIFSHNGKIKYGPKSEEPQDGLLGLKNEKYMFSKIPKKEK